MTLSELIAILELDTVFVPSSLEDLSVVNSEFFCRMTEKRYFNSKEYLSDILCILDELVNIFNNHIVTLEDFSLILKINYAGELFLELTHNCND